jgi:hypothetical protein
VKHTWTELQQCPLLFVIHASNTCMPCKHTLTTLLVSLSPQYLRIGIVDRCYNTGLLDSIHRRQNPPSCVGPVRSSRRPRCLLASSRPFSITYTFPPNLHFRFRYALGVSSSSEETICCLPSHFPRPSDLISLTSFLNAALEILNSPSDQLPAANPFRSLRLS